MWSNGSKCNAKAQSKEGFKDGEAAGEAILNGIISSQGTMEGKCRAHTWRRCRGLSLWILQGLSRQIRADLDKGLEAGACLVRSRSNKMVRAMGTQEAKARVVRGGGGPGRARESGAGTLDFFVGEMGGT